MLQSCLMFLPLPLLLVVLLLLPHCLGSAEAAFNCSAPPSFNDFNVNACCRTPEINLNGVPEKCQQHVNQLKSANKQYPAYAHMCYPECIYRETGTLVAGELDMAAVKQFLQQHVHRRDRDIIPEIVRSFDSCLSNIKSHMKAAKIEAYQVLPQGCSPFASMIYSCVNAETFLNCPKKMWKDERLCNVAREFAAQCNPLPHVPLPIS